MKKTITLIMFIGFCLTTYAQDTKEPTSKVTYELGVNASGITNLLLGGDGEVQEQTPYLFAYKAIGEEGRTFRAAIGGRFESSKATDTDRRDADNAIHMRVGYERQWRLSPKFVTSLGIDMLGGYSVLISESTFATTENKTWNIGSGPVWGIQWMISEHLSLYTETALYYRHRVSTDEVRFDNSTNPNPETLTEDKIKVILPASLYLAVRF